MNAVICSGGGTRSERSLLLPFLSAALALVALVGGFFISIDTANAASSGPQRGTTFSNDTSAVGTTSWTNVSDAATSNNHYAKVSLNTDRESSEYLKATGFGFSIPAGVTIKGIEVSIEKNEDKGNSVARIRDSSVRLVKSGTIVGNNYADINTWWGQSTRTTVYGSSTDTWGTSWTAAEINDAGTGVVISALHDNTNNNRDARIDYISMKVYYELDTTAPSGVSISYLNGYASSSVPVSFASGTDSGSGLNASTGLLARAAATLSADSCGVFSPFSALVATVLSPQTDATVAHGNCYQYTYGISDNSGNRATGTSASVVKVDMAPPTVTPPADQSFEATGPSTAPSITLGTAVDPTSGIFSLDYFPKSFPVGRTTLVWTAKDLAGNIGSSTSLIIIADTTKPAIDAHDNESVEATSPSGATVTFTAPNAIDLVDGTFAATCSPASGSTFAYGTTPVGCNATDVAGNSATQTTFNVIVSDTTKPVITLTGSATMNLNVGDSFTDPGATASDSADGNISSNLTVGGSVNTALPGTYTRAYNVTDAHGNTAVEVMRTVNVSDVSAPVIVPIADVTVEATNASGTVVSFTGIIAVDDVDGTTSPICTPPSGSIFPIGTTAVACEAADSSNNKGTGTGLNVTVRDTTVPTVTILPSTQTIEATGPAGATTSYTVSASDNIDGELATSTISCSPDSGSTFALGNTTVTCQATDAHGNRGSGTATVTIVDTTKPFSIIPPVAQYFEATGALTTPVLVLATSTDLVDPAPVIDYTLKSLPVGVNWLTWTATDHSGNPVSTTSKVVIIDSTAPEIDTPSGMTVEASTSTGATVTYTPPTAHDAVDGDRPADCSPASGSLFPMGTSTVACGKTDAAGNGATQRTFIVDVVHTAGPVITMNGTSPLEVIIGAGYTDQGATALDAFDGTVAVTATGTVDAMTVGTYTITYTASDSAGHTATPVVRTVNVVTPPPDTTPPTIASLAFPTPTTVVIVFSEELQNNELHSPQTSDFRVWSGDKTYTIDGVSYSNKTVTITLASTTPIVAGDDPQLQIVDLRTTVIDLAGNEFAYGSTYDTNVVDQTAPVITITGDNPASLVAGGTYTDAGATAADVSDGDITSRISVSSTVNTTVAGSYAVTYTVADLAGNTATATRAVNVTAVAGGGNSTGSRPGGGGGFVLGTSTVAGGGTNGSNADTLLAEARRLLAEASGGSGGGANGNTANNLLAEARRLAEAGDGNGGFVGQIGEGASTRNLAAIAALADRLATEGEEIAGTSTATGTSLINQMATAVGGFGLPSGWPARAGLIIIVLIILYLLYGFYRNRMGT